MKPRAEGPAQVEFCASRNCLYVWRKPTYQNLIGQQQDRPTACVITQLYSSVSSRYHYRREKFGTRFKNVTSWMFSTLLKLLNLRFSSFKLRTSGSALSPLPSAPCTRSIHYNFYTYLHLKTRLVHDQLYPSLCVIHRRIHTPNNSHSPQTTTTSRNSASKEFLRSQLPRMVYVSVTPCFSTTQTEAHMTLTAFWNATPCRMVEIHL
jgi:hypothetical protein